MIEGGGGAGSGKSKFCKSRWTPKAVIFCYFFKPHSKLSIVILFYLRFNKFYSPFEM